MRNGRMITALSLILALALSGLVVGQEIHKQIKIVQPQGDEGCCGMGEPGMKCMGPQFTEEQQKKIDELKLALEKELLPIEASLKVKEAELQQLMIADKPAKAAIEKKIDEIGALKTQIHKARVNNRLAVREILTPEQRVKFDKMGDGCCGGGMGKKMMFIGEGDELPVPHMMGGPCKMQVKHGECPNKEEVQVEVKEEK